MRVACDLDCTLFPLLDAMRLVPGGERVRYEDCPTWDSLPRLCDRPMDEIFAEAMRLEVAGRVGVYEGAVEVLARLRDDGVAIEVVTARPRELRRETEDFLDAFSVPHDALTVAHDVDKVAYCRERGIGVLLDDAPATIEKARDAGLAVLGLRHLYNRHLAGAGIELAPSWPELEAPLRRALGLRSAIAA